MLTGIDEPVPASIAFDARFTRAVAGSREALLDRWGALLTEPDEGQPADSGPVE